MDCPARWLLLAIACALAVLAYRPSGAIQFDRSIENMFRPDDPLLATYQRLKDLFGENEIVMAVYVDDQLLDESGAGIKRLEQVDQQLCSIPGVREVLSLSGVNRALNNTNPWKKLVGSEADPRAIVRRDSALASAFRTMFEGYTHDRQGQVATLVCMLEPESEAEVERRETIDQIRTVIQQHPNGMIAGEPVMVIDGFRYLERDGERLGWATRILLAIAIVACFGSLRWVLIPISVVQLTLLLTQATMVWCQLRLSMVSSMLTAIVTVVGVATVVHIIVRFRQARAQGMDQRAALVQTGALLAVPVFWACSTDAIGFLSLTVAKVGPVRDFGVMTAIGSMWVLVSVVLVVPGLALLGRFDADPRRVWGDKLLGWELGRLVHSSVRHRHLLLSLLVLLLIASLAGLWRLEIETDFTKNFRRGSPIVPLLRVHRRQAGRGRGVGCAGPGAGHSGQRLPGPDPRTATTTARHQGHERRGPASGGADQGPEPGGRHRRSGHQSTVGPDPTGAKGARHGGDDAALCGGPAHTLHTGR